MIAMLLAAGRGERLRPLTDQVPKALVEVNGESLLERHLSALHAAGIDTVVINLGWLGQQIAARVGSGSRYGLNVVYSPEGDDILETGGGIHRALPMLGIFSILAATAEIYTDMPLPGPDIRAGALAHLVLVPTPNHKPCGDFALVDGEVRNIEEPDLTFSGVAIYRPVFFAACEAGRFPLAPMLRDAAEAGVLSGSLYTGKWEDVGTPERLAALNQR